MRTLAAAWPALASLFALFLAILAWSTASSFSSAAGTAFALYGLPFVAFGVLAMVAAVAVAAWRGAYRRSAFLALALPALVPTACVGQRGGDVVHLLVVLPSYAARTGMAPGAHFDWGGEGSGSAEPQRTLVYEPRGDDALRPGLAPRIRNARVVTVSHLLGPFYVVDEDP